MDVIPVVDVRHGLAVRAIAGDRARYAPLTTPLAVGSAPEAVAAGLMALHPFRALYVADLDGIEGRGADLTLIRRLLAAVPVDAEVWIDAGIADGSALSAALAVDDRVVPVLGSEVGWTPARLAALDPRARSRVVLSLDFRGAAFVGEPALLQTPHVWPERVIAMTLSAIGGGGGPDIDRLRPLRALAPAHRLYAAGGVRDRADLTALSGLCINGALVASALHSGRLVLPPRS